ncbi:MAG: 50S ribosomal protein L29 [Dehalococcoidia bacterium]
MSKEATELRALNDADLAKALDEAHQALFNLRFQAATRQLANTSQIEKTRRRIARARTLIRERAILAELDSAIAAAGNGE